MITKKRSLALVACLSAFMVADVSAGSYHRPKPGPSPVPPSSAIDFDLTGEDNQGSYGFGNSLSFSVEGVDLDVYAYGTSTTDSYGELETAELFSWSTGLGVCNQLEGSLKYDKCSDSQHEVDTIGAKDVVVFYFGEETVNFESLTVAPYQSSRKDPNDRDIIYWVGQTTELPDFSGQTLDALASLSGITAETESPANNSYKPYTHELSGSGNLLIVSGDYLRSNCKTSNNKWDSGCEAYKITGLSVSEVPVPAAAWLFLSALIGLVGIRRR